MLQDATAQQTAKLIYQTALLESGFLLEDPKEFASRIYSVMRTNLNVSPDATVEEEEEEVTSSNPTTMCRGRLWLWLWILPKSEIIWRCGRLPSISFF